jgi:hypothetical protein
MKSVMNYAMASERGLSVRLSPEASWAQVEITSVEALRGQIL